MNEKNKDCLFIIAVIVFIIAASVGALMLDAWMYRFTIVRIYNIPDAYIDTAVYRHAGKSFVTQMQQRCKNYKWCGDTILIFR